MGASFSTWARWDDTVVYRSQGGQSSPRSDGVSLIHGARNLTINGGTFTVRQSNVPHDLKRLRKNLDFLSPVNFRSIYAENLSKWTPGALQWYFESSLFQFWLETQGAILWGTGMPGAGKTILASVAIKHMEGRASTSSDICVAFVYCRYTERMEVRDILAALVRQLLESYPYLQPLVESLCEKHQTRNTMPTQDELLEVIRAICATFTVSYLFIDGLDEALPDDQFNLLHALKSIKANFMLTSRPLVLLQDVLPEATFFEIVAREDDIKLLVDERIDSIPDLRQLLKRHGAEWDVAKKVCDTAHGMFLQASLLVENIRYCTTLKGVLSKLEQLPEGLGALYTETFERIEKQPEDRARLARRVLTWVVYAQDQLSVEDLKYAVVDDPEADWNDPTSFVEESTMISVCCGLLTVEDRKPPIACAGTASRSNQRFVRLIHYTASDALRHMLEKQEPSPHQTLTRIALLRLASSSIADISAHPSHHYPDHATSAAYKDWIRTFLNATPLLAYSFEWWSTHFLKSIGFLDSPACPTTTQALGFFATCTCFPARLNLSSHEGFDYLTSPIHLVAHYGLTPLVSSLSSHINDVTRGGRTALALAASRDDDSSMRAILNIEGINVNAQDNNGFTPLMSAALNGCSKAVDLLLKRSDVKVNLQSKKGQTALLCSVLPLLGIHSPRKAECALRLLSAPGINANIPDMYGITPFMMAVDIYPIHVLNEFIARQLVDISKLDSRGQTILMFASHAETKTFRWIARLPGVDSALKDRSGATALMYRAGSRVVQSSDGYLEDFRTLLKGAENLNDTDNFGLTALGHAVVLGYIEAIDALLQLPNIDQDVRDSKGRTLLMLAAMHNRHPVILDRVKELQGANVNAIEEEGQTALMFAAQSFKFNIDIGRSIKWLLESKGINPNAARNDGLNALHLLISAAVLRTARSMLSKAKCLTLVNDHEKNLQHKMLILGGGHRFTLRQVTRMAVNLESTVGDGAGIVRRHLLVVRVDCGNGTVVAAREEVQGDGVMGISFPDLEFPWANGWIAEEFDTPVQLLLNRPDVDDCGFGYLRRPILG